MTDSRIPAHFKKRPGEYNQRKTFEVLGLPKPGSAQDRRNRPVRVLADDHCLRRFCSVERAVAYVADRTGKHPDYAWEQMRKGGMLADDQRVWEIDDRSDY